METRMITYQICFAIDNFIKSIVLNRLKNKTNKFSLDFFFIFDRLFDNLYVYYELLSYYFDSPYVY